jgi:hypothetical protein
LLLGLAAAALAGCGEQESALDQQLPAILAGVSLERETFAGPTWLKAKPEPTLQPELGLDVHAFLRRLRKMPSDLTVAWAVAPDGPKVFAYRVGGTKPTDLVRAYVESVEERPQAVTAFMARKRITVVTGDVRLRNGYLYAHGDVLYAAGSDHVSPPELRELLSKLP